MDESSVNTNNRVVLCICVIDEQSIIKSVHINSFQIRKFFDHNFNGSNSENVTDDESISVTVQNILQSNAPFREELSIKLHTLCKSNSASDYKYHLTCREKEVLKLLIDGFTKKEIGNKLFVSYNTIGTHVSHIYHKLNVTNRGSAVAKTLMEDLLP
jgi:DNA-binding NarL/FixJ family response regulator